MIKRLVFSGVELKNNIFTAPLAGYTDIPWRNVMKDRCAGVVVTEMISTEAVIRDSWKTFNMLENIQEYKSESSLCVQLFGNDPESFKKAVKIVQDRFGYNHININMGCPAPKVLKAKAGCHFLKEFDEAEKLIGEVRKVTKGILSVKTRLGVNANDSNGLTLCNIAQNNGADVVIVHARTFKQGFSGNIDLERLAQLKNNLKIPVIGNGDIKSLDDVEYMYKKTGVDGFMIGRGLFGNPDLICNIIGQKKDSDIKEFFKEHFENMIKYYGEEKAYRNIKKFIPYYRVIFPKKDKIALLTSLSYHEFIKNLKQTGIIL
jgi:tRNA-dihydrouridine synthase B